MFVDHISRKLLDCLAPGVNFKQSKARRTSEGGVNITRILLTGGPCAGKTTALAAISQDLSHLGYKVLIVPEAATLIMKGGAMIVSSSFSVQ